MQQPWHSRCTSNGILLPPAEGLGRQLWPPAVAASCGQGRGHCGLRRAQHPAALPWAQWDWVGMAGDCRHWRLFPARWLEPTAHTQPSW